jgi:putative transposase
VPCGAGQGFVGTAWQPVSVRTAYRCRAYPDAAQQAVLNRTFGCVRVAWNQILAVRRERYITQRTGTSYGQASAALTAMKQDPQRAWLNEVSCVPLQQALRHQQQAFAAFFAKRARYPRFKSRRGRQAAEYTRSAFTMRDGQLRLAKTPRPLAFVWSWPGVDVAGLDPTTVFVSKEPDGRWYVTFATDASAPAPPPEAGRAAGVDLGISSFAVTSHGERIANPRHLERKARNLARYQRRLARCQKGSANRAKARAKVARAHRKIANARRDFLHKTTTGLVRGNDLIAIENLAVTNMVRNRRLARAISDCGWGEFRRQLEYKCERADRQLVVISRWYPSSKTCSACKFLLAELSLSVRTWRCPSCRVLHDRDVNAAKNILAAGLAGARGLPGDACGAGVRHPETPPVQSAVKQEPQPVTAGIPVPQGGE